MIGFFGNHSLIGRRLITYTVLFSSSLALIFTIFQVNVEYGQELKHQKTNQQLIEDSLLDSLAQSIWTFDDAQIASQLRGIANIPAIEQVTLILPDNIRFKVGQVHSSQVKKFNIDVFFSPSVNEKTNLGQLQFYYGMDATYIYLLQYAAIMLLFNMIKTVLVIAFMLFLIDRLIGQHLYKISRYLSQYQDNRQLNQLVLTRDHYVENDEIEQVVKSLNKMQQSIYFEQNRAKLEAQKRELLQQQVIEQKEQVLSLERNIGLAAMAITLADELNRPLSKVCDYTNMCKKMLLESTIEPHLLLNLVDKLHHEAEQAVDILERSQNVLINTQPSLEFVDINRVIRRVIKLLGHDVEDAEIVLSHHCGDTQLLVYVDELQIEQVLINLIRNAIDALTEQPQAIRLIDITAWDDGHSTCLRVEDNGTGFGLDALSELFKPFFTTKEQSIGVGLSISQNLIAAMGGTITARNRLDRGACFTITLPLPSRSVATDSDGSHSMLSGAA